MDIFSLVLLGIIIFITHFIQGVTGFGSSVLALPFAVWLLGIRVSVPLLISLSMVINTYIIFVSFRDINFKEYWKMTAIMGLGLPPGVIAFSKMPEMILKIILAVFMVVVAVKGLYNSFNQKKNLRKMSNSVLNFILFLGGCIQGAFGSGGPLVVVYATQKLNEKSNFRSTLCMVWFTINCLLVVQNIYRGVLSYNVIKLFFYLVPSVILGAVAGKIFHERIEEEFFSKLVYSILLTSGIFMFF